jgi:hypothetical protein
LQPSGQENGDFFNRCRYVHQTAENLGFPGKQPSKKFKVSFDERGTSFLTSEHKCHPSPYDAFSNIIIGVFGQKKRIFAEKNAAQRAEIRSVSE